MGLLLQVCIFSEKSPAPSCLIDLKCALSVISDPFSSYAGVFYFDSCMNRWLHLIRHYLPQKRGKSDVSNVQLFLDQH